MMHLYGKIVICVTCLKTELSLMDGCSRRQWISTVSMAAYPCSQPND